MEIQSEAKLNTGTGFVPDFLYPDQWILGGIGDFPKKIIKEDRDWRDSIPEFEPQHNRFIDSFGCTIWAWLNAIEIYLIGKDNKTINFSDKALYIASKTYPPGNSPHTIAQTIKNFGLIEEFLMPFGEPKSIEELRTPDPIPTHLENLAKEWTNKNIFRHRWLYNPMSPIHERKIKILQALKRSPVPASVNAWKQDSNGIYVKDENERDNHLTCIVYGNDDYAVAYDSYEPELKKVSWDNHFEFAKEFTIDKPTTFNFLNFLCKRKTAYS